MQFNSHWLYIFRLKWNTLTLACIFSKEGQVNNNKPEKIINMLFKRVRTLYRQHNSSFEVMMKGVQHNLAVEEVWYLMSVLGYL